mgnify:CR=1 FL=1
MPSAIYASVKPEEVEKIIKDRIESDLSDALAVRRKKNQELGNVLALDSLPEWRHQVRFVSRNYGLIDSESIEDYLKTSGYSGPRKAIRLSREEVIEIVGKSGLRGRGGRLPHVV